MMCPPPPPPQLSPLETVGGGPRSLREKVKEPELVQEVGRVQFAERGLWGVDIGSCTLSAQDFLNQCYLRNKKYCLHCQ